MFKKLLTIFSLFVFISSHSVANTSEQLETLLAKHQGNIIYLDFWASWCGPCRKSFPWMNKMHAQYGEKGLSIISVNVDTQRHFATEFLSENSANFPILYDPKGIVAKRYQLKGMPSSFILNRQGKIISAHVGFTEEKRVKYELELSTLLANQQ